MFNVGDKVVCTFAIDNLTYGKVYQVLDNDNWDGRAVVQVIDDVGEECWYYNTRFTSAIISQQDPLVTIPQSEYDNLITEVNMLQELVAELTNKLAAPQDTAQGQFKPISEYTLEDWELAKYEGWVFECRDGGTVQIKETYPDCAYVIRGDDGLTRAVNGLWWQNDTDHDDIVKRIE